jgi:hypothetical protein
MAEDGDAKDGTRSALDIVLEQQRRETLRDQRMFAASVRVDRRCTAIGDAILELRDTLIPRTVELPVEERYKEKLERCGKYRERLTLILRWLIEDKGLEHCLMELPTGTRKQAWEQFKTHPAFCYLAKDTFGNAWKRASKENLFKTPPNKPK